MPDDVYANINDRLKTIEKMLIEHLKSQAKIETRLSMLEGHKNTVTKFLWTITGGIVTIGVFFVKNHLGV